MGSATICRAILSTERRCVAGRQLVRPLVLPSLRDFLVRKPLSAVIATMSRFLGWLGKRDIPNASLAYLLPMD